MANQLFLHKLKSYAEQIGTISKEEVLVLNAKKKNLSCRLVKRKKKEEKLKAIRWLLKVFRNFFVGLLYICSESLSADLWTKPSVVP